ncbi:hypothetical protein Hdeb2414_s0024g00654291 [Helianthus debilis subsp. tardiflorus]
MCFYFDSLGVYFGWSGVFGCNYVGYIYTCYGWKLVPCRLVLLGKVFRFVTVRRTNNIGMRYSLEPWQVNTLVRIMMFFMAPTHY